MRVRTLAAASVLRLIVNSSASTLNTLNLDMIGAYYSDPAILLHISNSLLPIHSLITTFRCRLSYGDPYLAADVSATLCQIISGMTALESIDLESWENGSYFDHAFDTSLLAALERLPLKYLTVELVGTPASNHVARLIRRSKLNTVRLVLGKSSGWKWDEGMLAAVALAGRDRSTRVQYGGSWITS